MCVHSAIRASHGTGGPDYDSISDLELAAAISRREAGAMRLVMQRYDRRLFRAAWRILGNREDAEDAVQDTYLKAFAAISSFEGRSSLSTWLTRIVINNALAHARAAGRRRSLLEESEFPILDRYFDALMRGSMSVSPEHAAECGQMREIVIQAIDKLPAPFRDVFMLRQIEELDVAEVSVALGIPAATVKTRHLRARRRLQRLIGSGLCDTLSDKYSFSGAFCELRAAASAPAGIGVDPPDTEA